MTKFFLSTQSRIEQNHGLMDVECFFSFEDLSDCLGFFMINVLELHFFMINVLELKYASSRALQSATKVALFESVNCFSYGIFVMIRVLQAYQPLSHTVKHLNGIVLEFIHLHLFSFLF